MEQKESLKKSRKGPLKIVLVDDEYDQVIGLEQALKNSGFEVYYADDGNKGLALVAALNPDLLLLDLSMPGRSGFLVLEHLRADGDATCPVIVVTAIEGQRHRDYAMTLGADGFFRKPYAIDEMLDSVKRLIGKRNR